MKNTRKNTETIKKTYPDIDAIADEIMGQSARRTRNIPFTAAEMPSLQKLEKLMDLLRSVFFPGFFGISGLGEHTARRRMASELDNIFRLLAEQIRYGICFSRLDENGGTSEIYEHCGDMAFDMASDFIRRAPVIRDLLDSDVLAAYEGDPAAKSKAETIFCYPSIHTMTNHRVAHELYRLSVPVIPRIISEMAHSRTGIDINPGASIGEEFFIDHGTGVVIGETAVIGNRCRIYQGVTLGALSFPKDG